MAQDIDSSTATAKSRTTHTAICACIGSTTQSPIVAPTDDKVADECVQNIDPSHASTASHLADCNLECCTCAARWSARRNLLEMEA